MLDTDNPLKPIDLDVPVRQIMRHGVIVIAEDATLDGVFQTMADHHIHAVLVEEAATGRPLGWVKAESLLTWLNLEAAPGHAHEAITESVVTIAPDAPVRDAIALLSRTKTSHLLVCAEGSRAGEGVVTALDVVALRAR